MYHLERNYMKKVRIKLRRKCGLKLKPQHQTPVQVSDDTDFSYSWGFVVQPRRGWTTNPHIETAS